MKTLSQNERILALLSDRQPHRVPDIHRAVGTCRLNSRVAELRKRLRREGQTIVCRHLEGTGAEAYEYQIVLLEKVKEPTPALASSSGAVSAGSASADGITVPLQLELLEVALVGSGYAREVAA